MKNIKNFIYITIIVFSVLACKPDKVKPIVGGQKIEKKEVVNWQEITNEYFIWQIPDNLETVDFLSNDRNAYMQILDKKNQLFAIVIQDSLHAIKDVLHTVKGYNPKESDFKNYCDFFINNNQKKLEQYKELLNESSIKNQDSTKLVNYSSVLTNNDTQKKEPIFYSNYYVNGGGNYFQVIIWTNEEKREKNQEIINRMIESFEVNHIN